MDIGDSSGDYVAVTGSLNEGDRVAIRGAENLSDGCRRQDPRFDLHGNQRSRPLRQPFPFPESAPRRELRVRAQSTP